MEITIYRLHDGHYVLMPACFLPSMECRHEHGPLTRCGQISIADALCARSWTQVLSDIDHHTYAMISAAQAERLLGPQHACLHHDGAFAEPMAAGFEEAVGTGDAGG